MHIFVDCDNYVTLLSLAEKKTLLVNRIQQLEIEVYKCVNNMSPSFVCELFEEDNTPYNMRDNSPLKQRKFQTKKYGFRSFGYMGSKLWNEMPVEIKRATTLAQFKRLLSAWDGPCICSTWC